MALTKAHNRMIASAPINIVDFGAVGNNSDESTSLAAALAAAAGTGTTVYAEPDKTYRFSTELTVDGCTLDFRGSTVVLAHSGQVNCFLVANGGSILNAYIKHEGVVGGGISGIAQYPILGYNLKNAKFDNLRFSAPLLANRVAIAMYGDVENIEVSNITFEGSANWGQGIIFHWLCEDNTVNASALNKTNHPRNLTITNIVADTFTNTGSLVSVLFLSGCYNTVVNNIRCEEARRLISVIAGDYADEFSVDRDKPFVGGSTCITNPVVNDVKNAAIRVDGDGVLTSNRVRMGVTINNPTLASLTNTVDGIVARRCSGVIVNGGKISGFRYNILAAAGVTGLLVDGSEITEGYKRGIAVDGGGETISNVKITNCKIYNNNIEDISDVNNSGIYIFDAEGVYLGGNMFGVVGGSEKQHNSVYVYDNCDNVTFSSNHTYSARTNDAYNIRNTTPYSMNIWNSHSSSETTNNFVGHVVYEALAFNKRRFIFDGSSGVPASGTWTQGDELNYRNPTAGGFRGAVCTSSGTPGTWKTFGTIAP